MIQTWSKFLYGFDVDSESQYLDLVEGDGSPTAQIDFGNYTIGEGLEAVQDALNAAGHNTYTVSIDRLTGLVTIAADDTFDLPIVSGPTAANSIFDLLGFTGGSDLTGASSYTGNARCGFEYSPQFLLQDYVPPEHFIESVDASVNRSASGRVEVVRFGTEQKLEMNIKYITNYTGVEPIRVNTSGVEDALHFLRYITQKKRFEFLPDEDDGDTLHKVILESFPGFRNGTGFRLKEMISRGVPGVYETGIFQLRVVS